MFGPSRRRPVGVLVRLDEDAGDADRDRGARQHRHELALRRREASPWPPGCCTEWVASKTTGAAGRRAMMRQAAHVGDERVVAEAGAALGQTRTFGLPDAATLRATFFMSQGARNWPFLTLTARPVSAAATQQVGLAAEEGRDLQHVDDLGDRRALLGLVHVGEHRQAEALACTSAKIAQRLARARCRGRSRRLVRLALSNELLKMSADAEPLA